MCQHTGPFSHGYDAVGDVSDPTAEPNLHVLGHLPPPIREPPPPAKWERSYSAFEIDLAMLRPRRPWRVKPKQNHPGTLERFSRLLSLIVRPMFGSMALDLLCPWAVILFSYLTPAS